MLHDFGSRQGAVLGDVTHQQHGHAALFGIALQLGGAFAYLRHTSRTRLDQLGADGLDGIDNDQLGLHGGDVLEDALHGGFAHHVALGSLAAGDNAVGTHLDLLLAFLAADVEDALSGHSQCSLQQEGALAYAGFAAYEQQRAGDDAAAQHPVELGAAGWQPLCLAVGDLLDELGCGDSHAFGCRLLCCGGCGFQHLLVEGVPLAALGAAAQPTAGLVAALTAEIVCLCFSHLLNVLIR